MLGNEMNEGRGEERVRMVKGECRREVMKRMRMVEKADDWLKGEEKGEKMIVEKGDE